MKADRDTFGPRLRLERERKGIALSDIAVRDKNQGIVVRRAGTRRCFEVASGNFSTRTPVRRVCGNWSPYPARIATLPAACFHLTMLMPMA